jgi:hypothetical protein
MAALLRGVNCRIVFGVALKGHGVIVATESSLLTTKEILAKCIESFQLLQTKSVVAHFRIREDLGGCGLTPVAESALLVKKKILAEANPLSQLLELKEVLLQVFFLGQAVLGQAGAGGIEVVLLDWIALLLTKKPANASQLLQPLQARDPMDAAQLGEPLEQTVATLGFEKLAFDLGKLLLDFEVETAGLIQLAQKGDGIGEIG